MWPDFSVDYKACDGPLVVSDKTARDKSADATRVTVDGVMEFGLSYLWNADFYLD